MAAKQRTRPSDGETPGLNERLEDFSTSDFQECLKRGSSHLECGDLCQAEESFADALRLVAGESREREAVCLLYLGEVYKKQAEQSSQKDHAALVKASALLNAALARINDTSDRLAYKGDPDKLSPSSSQDDCSSAPPTVHTQEQQEESVSTSTIQVPQDRRNKIKTLLQDIEVMFVSDIIGRNVPKEFQTDNVAEHKKELTRIRSDCERELDNIAEKFASVADDKSDEERKRQELAQGTAVRDLYCMIAEDMKTFVRDLWKECLGVVGSLPGDVSYAVVGLGSLAREEMTPYSDLEFAILVEEGNNTDDVRGYFEALTRYLHLKILNLGETILPAVGVRSLNDFTGPNPLDDWYHDSFTPRGFAFDGAMPWASKTPLGREQGITKDQLKGLILTPSEMAALQTDPRALDWSHLREVLTCVTLIHGDPLLVENYEIQLYKILFGQVDESGTTLGMRRATKHLMAALQEFKSDLSGMLSAGKLFQVKKEIYRMPSILLSSLALFFGIKEKSSWEVVQALRSKGVINSEAEHNLKVAVSIATQLRLCTYLSNRGQKDSISTLPKVMLQSLEGQKGDKNPVHSASDIFGMESYSTLFRFFQTVLPLEECIESLHSSNFDVTKSSAFEVTLSILQTRLQISFAREEFYDSSLKNRSLVHMRLLQYQDAEACLERYIAESDKDDVSQSRLLIGQVQYHLGDYAGAVRCFTSLADQTTSKKNDRISIITFLGQAHHQNGDLVEASRCFEEALEELTKKTESDLPKAVILNNLACAMQSFGKYKEAISCFQEALALDGGGKKQRQGNPRVAVILNNMGDAYQSTCQYDKAIHCYIEAFTIEQKIYGDNRAHPFIAATLHNLGSAYRDIGNFLDAITAFQSSLQIKEIVFGKNAMHPEIAGTLDGLASMKRRLGDVASAKQLTARALLIRRSAYGQDTDNLEIAESLSNMGINSLDSHEGFQQSLSLFEEAYAIRKRMLKDRPHPCIGRSLQNIGVALFKLQQYELAKTKHQEALEIFRQVFAPDAKNADIAGALGGIGSCLCHLGDKTEGRQLLEEAVTVWKATSGSSHPDITRLYSSLAKVMLEQGDLSKATATLTEALDIVRRVDGARCSVAASKEGKHTTEEGASTSYPLDENVSEGNDEETGAVKAGDGKLKVLPRSYTADEATILGELGVACVLSGDDRAMSFLQESLSAVGQVHGQNHHSYANALGNLGAATLQGGNVTKAIEHFTESLHILEGLYGKEGTHEKLEQVLNNLGYAYEAMGELRTALVYFDRVIDIQKRKGTYEEPGMK